MFLSIRRYDQVRSVGEVCRKIELSFVPLLKRQPGFIAYYAVDGGGGTMATVSVFSTEQMAVDSNELAADWLRRNVADLQPEPPTIVAGKVLVTGTP
ncbi:MAG: hypothetical protein MUE49_02725 [Rhodospirillales bacterium]|jgi:hypothetical protein|nr:hypothetical protein [Rhodospirillales bacterium]